MSYTRVLRDTYDCHSCGARAGQPCTTKDGRNTPPHQDRWDQPHQTANIPDDRKDQEDQTMNNDDERDYEEEAYNAHLMDDERDPELGLWGDSAPLDADEIADARAEETDPDEGYTPRLYEPPAESDYARAMHRTQALYQDGLCERSDPEYATAAGLSALTHAVLALSAPAEKAPDHNWRQRAMEAEAALTAIGGVVASRGPGYAADRLNEIDRILRESGREADRLMPPGLLTPHTGVRAHDGYEPHSHEVRPDHKGVRRDPS